MNKKIKRIVSVCIALIMLLGTAPIQKMVFAADLSDLSVGDTIEFGTYPQEDSSIPDFNVSEMVDEWTSLGLYGGNNYAVTNEVRIYENGSMKPVDAVMYSDFEYNGIKYRALKITGTKPEYTGQSWTPCDAVYKVFRFEPIKWKVTKVSPLTLEAVKSIDCRPFNQYLTLGEDGKNYSDEACTKNPTNFTSSSLYKWLNDDFYNTAFSDTEKSGISGKVTTVSASGLSGSVRQNNPKYMTPYAKSFGKVEDGVWWSTTVFSNNQGDSRKLISVFGASDNRYVSSLTVGVVPSIIVSHIYEKEITKEATCTEKGILTYTCSICGDKYTEEIPVIPHTYTESVVAPSCTEKGYTEYTCICGDSYKDNYTEPTGHSYTAETVAPTDTENGYTKHTCSLCGDTYNDTYIDPLGHNYSSEIIKSPTCVESGTVKYTCTTCDDSFTEEIPPTGHSFVSEITKPATCTEKGIITYYCENCEEYYSDYIPLTEHKLTHIIEKASCTENGREYDICSECKNKFNEKLIPAAGHSYVPETTKEASCTEAGIITYTCSCGNSFTEEIPFAEHKLTHIIEKASCAESGREYDICSVCSGVFDETEIPTAGHIYENGVCTVCGKVQGWDYTVNNGTVTITNINSDERNLEIPPEIGGYPVTAIAESAFENNAALEYVSIPNSVFIIGRNAFRGCTNLKEICISDSVSTICEGAFADCTSLAIVFIASVNTALKGAFSNNDSRLTFIVPEETKTAANVSEEGFAYNTFMYPKEKDGKGAIAVSGTVTLYQDLEYNYWSKLIEKYPYAFYLYFDSLVFDGVEEDEIIVLEDSHIDTESRYLTMNEVYISINVDGRSVTFRELINMLRDGNMEAAITFADSQGVKRTFLQRVGDFFEDLFNAISKVINAIVKIFKKK